MSGTVMFSRVYIRSPCILIYILSKLADWLLLGGIGLIGRIGRIGLIGRIGRISQISLIGLIDCVVGDVGGDGFVFCGVEEVGRWAEWVLVVLDGCPAYKLHA